MAIKTVTAVTQRTLTLALLVSGNAEITFSKRGLETTWQEPATRRMEILRQEADSPMARVQIILKVII